MKPSVLPGRLRATRWQGVLPDAAPVVAWECAAAGAEPVVICLLPREADIAYWLAVWRSASELAGVADRWRVVPLPAPLAGEADEPLPERMVEDNLCDRSAAYAALAAGHSGAHERLVVVTTPAALLAPVATRAALERHRLVLERGRDYPFAELVRALAEDLDYDAEPVCEYPGQYAVRGGLLDVYPLNGDKPVRLDFFGDTLDAIRGFDPATQLSSDKLESVIIAGRTTADAAKDSRHILGYLPPAICWVMAEPAALVAAHDTLFTDFERLNARRFGFVDLVQCRADAKDRWTCISELDTDHPLLAEQPDSCDLAMIDPAATSEIDVEGVFGLDRSEAEDRRQRAVLTAAKAARKDGYTIVVVFGDEGESERWATLLNKHLSLNELAARCVRGVLRTGFQLARPAHDKLAISLLGGWSTGERGLLVLTGRELFARQRHKMVVARQRLLPTRAAVDHLLDFAELVDGDHLVHLSHGICQYRGLLRMTVRGRDEEVISVEFADGVLLHVPLQESHLLTRYVGLSKAAPRLSRIGSGVWEKTRRAAEVATLDYAASMLKIQAQRTEEPGFAFAPDSDWVRSFEACFPYRETRDQLRAIEQTKADMERPQPMDRLICGDVGFGKTEVALRAAFKAAMDGKQTAILVPTTVLAQQHWQTFRERLSAFPVSVEMLSRFRPPRAQKEILRKLGNGSIDIVVGTHRLLGRDVRFANLGLLVIDEEHRFGVRHKERIKEMRTDVDVLTMSATPIPRTLYLALMGARDLSVIETPPADRLPIETVVRSYDPATVQRAIDRELARGGQVFYLHNRVQTIESVAAMLGQMFPQARIAVGHGQMDEADLESVMTRFVAGESDILVCTTIIENGIDIPNCNTIIIEGADRFGLSQLYQLRGRVGRFTRQAYAYLLLHRHSHLVSAAHKRLAALRQHNQLGAGFKIAMRDLELRGAGNLLGAQQSGHIAGVGFDLYCQLLRQSISRLKGEPSALHIHATVNLDFIRSAVFDTAGDGGFGFAAIRSDELADGTIQPAEALIPADYIADTRLRIDFYRQLAMAADAPAVASLEAALADRFGALPPPVRRVVALARIRVLAEAAGIRSIECVGNQLRCVRASGRSDDFIKIGARFPRLNGTTADKRLTEIQQFLKRQQTTPGPPHNPGQSPPAKR
jgi:transcription-repair coupling factor (superfamily II helicase)